MTAISWPSILIQVKNSIDFYKVEMAKFGKGTYPETHIENSQQLKGADGKAELFQIILANDAGTLYFKNNTAAKWQGNTYQATELQLTGVGNSATDQTYRPQFAIFNPDNVFHSLVDAGSLDNAKLVRFRVLKDHLDRDLPIYTRQMWKFTRVASLKLNIAAFELRDMLDGQIFVVPARMYMPPEFPAVSL